MKILEGKNKNLVFYLFIVIALIYVLIANQVGSDQDAKNLNDYQQFQTATDLTNRQKYADAEPTLKSLSEKYKDSFLIQWQYAICQDGLGNYQEAEKYYSLVQDIRPFIVENQYYLVQRGKVLYQLGKYSDAKKYLLYSKKVNESPDLTSLSDQLLSAINKKS